MSCVTKLRLKDKVVLLHPSGSNIQELDGIVWGMTHEQTPRYNIKVGDAIHKDVGAASIRVSHAV